jgi:ribosomal protein S1
MKEDIVSTNALNYNSIKCGMFVSATVEEVNEKEKFIGLRVNEFVKGRLYIEHMADFTVKVIPPKFTKIGKEMNVRVFFVDHETRYIEFTKKDTLLKEKTPVYQSYKDAGKGSKIVGVIVD